MKPAIPEPAKPSSSEPSRPKLIRTIFPRGTKAKQIADWLNEQRRKYPPPKR